MIAYAHVNVIDGRRETDLAVRFTFFEAIYAILVVGGGLLALAADKLGMDKLKDASIAIVFLGIVVFGLDMVVKRRAEIGTKYSSSVNPSFHVFRGWGAVAWGIAFVLVGTFFIGTAYLSLTNWTAARQFFGEHSEIFIILAGFGLTAVGFGSATKATYRYRQSEHSAARLADRIGAIMVVLPLGLAILGWGFLKAFAPSVANEMVSVLKASALRWLEFLFN